MSTNDLPVTVDPKQSPLGGSEVPQSTTGPETEGSAEAMSALDLRGYELSERLGGGGMGDVYRSADPALGRDLAVKIMKADLQGYAAAEQRFLREARVTGSLQHPGIVPIHNLGRLADGRLHYTMRLVRGRTFADILHEEAGQAQRLPALLAIFEKICQAVAYAHSKQVIHRDLKPANVMVGRFGEVQVMDWGLAKLLTAEEEPAAAQDADERAGTRIHTEAEDTPLAQTRMGREMGTPAYMPPEQALGEWDAVDERADVFALGAVLCEILTGQPPYQSSESGVALRKAKRGDLSEALARLDGCGIEATLANLCRDCLAQVREGRPRDAEQVAQRVAAYRAEVQERLRRAELERAAAVVQARWERKRHGWMLASVVVLLAGTTIITWQAVRATKAEGWALAAAEAERKVREAEIEQRKQAEDQKQRAEANAQKAEKSEADTQAVLAFFQNKVLAAGRPMGQEGGLGKDVTLRQAVDKAKQDIADTFKGRPLVEASIRDALGTTYWYLGETALAIEQCEQALALRRAQLGPEHPYTLACVNNLANAHWSAGRTTEAIALHQQNLKQREAKLGADHPDTLLSRHNLARAFWSAGRSTDAIRLHEQNLKQRAAKLGADHSDTLLSRHHLANAYHSAGRTAEAIPLFEQTLKQQEAKLGPNHPETLFSRGGLAQAYWSTGRTSEAISLFEQTLKPMEARLGLAHSDTIICRNNLACAYQSAGRIAEAIRLHEHNLNQTEAQFGPTHANTLFVRRSLAYSYQSAGRTGEAIRLHEQTFKRCEAKLGPDHASTLVSMARLGVAYRDNERIKEAIALLEAALQRGCQRSGGLSASLAWLPGALAQIYDQAGQFAKAETIYRDALEQARRKSGSDDPRTANACSLLGLNLLKQTKFRDAEPLLRQCLAIREKKQPDVWNTFNARSMLGEALLGQKKYTEAEPLLVQGYEGMKQRQDKILLAHRQICLNDALERLARLYEATGQKDKAVEYRKELEQTRTVQKKAKP